MGKGQPGFPGLSLWALDARGSFYKILAVLAVVTLAECAIFYGLLSRMALPDIQEGNTLVEAVPVVQGGDISAMTLSYSLEDILSITVLPGFLLAWGAVYGILILTRWGTDHRSRETLLRLRVDRTGIFFIRTVYNICCFLTVGAVQTGTVIWMVTTYGQMTGLGQRAPQMLFLAFHRIGFLHSLVPMADAGGWICSILLILALGMEAAGTVGRRRQVTQVALALVAGIRFAGAGSMAFLDVVCGLSCGLLILMDLHEAGVWEKLAGGWKWMAQNMQRRA